ncbi:uroporphyrinogen decarboxylase family protein [Labilibacter marinus]|uniref:uroporphyrinogen decarboxylase family protein n=1 Tax=Labilibacter marinus TaxID=1477105 RepID=UPI0008350BDA|nr:uroporphyrinogen decarboxylase family protein [Labilibacter marinus]
MNSRQRVIASIEHKQTSKVPFDIGSNPSSGISAIAYSNLLKHMGKDKLPVKIFDVVQQLAQPDMQILNNLGVDVIDIGVKYNTATKDWYETTLANGDTAFYPNWFKPEKLANGEYLAKDKMGEVIAKMPQGATFFDQTIFPWQEAFPSDLSGLKQAMDKVLWSAFAHSPWDHAHQDNFWQDLRSKAIQLRQESDQAIMITVGCNLFEWGTFLRRMDNFLMDPYMYPEETNKLLDALMKIHMETLEKVVESVGDVIDIIRFGDDLGMTSGPLVPPEVYAEFYKPRHTILNDYVKKHSNMKTFLHSCGSIYQLIPDLIAAGFDILNPVQTNCVDMEPERLKREFGKDITFWGGGADTTTVLNKASVEEVRKHCLERLEIFSKDGGFIFNPVHNIIPDVPAENIIAMVNAVNEFNGDDAIIF